MDTNNNNQQLREAFSKLATPEIQRLATAAGLISLKGPAWLDKFITEDADTKLMKRMVETLIDYDDPVLIEGESGTGKELIANALHGDRVGNFIPVNCAGLPEQLVESELFGHVDGAFTGAVRSKSGLFETAQNGTLFIDEIGEMPLSVQPKLLRVIQERSVRRVGANTFTPINCRVVAATHRDLAEMMRRGAFREDLYWRIATYTVTIKPLRERRGDIHEMLDGVLDKEGVLDEGVRTELEGKELRGNYRELEAWVKREKLRMKLYAKTSTLT